MSQLGAVAEEIRNLGAEIVGLAVTATFSQMAFAQSLGIDFPLLSDWEGTTAEAFGVRYDIWKGHRGLAKRSLFLIQPDGTIAYRWVTDDALQLPDLSPLLEALRALRRG
ncbi:MAG TPA: redoxin domain-containing protein [Acidimicrobiia bacterium]|nr:redoxin domain-containing protein [Acidimicrobiia bacterium]